MWKDELKYRSTDIAGLSQMTDLRNYSEIVGHEIIEEIFALGRKLSGKRVVHVNSTKTGGGVVEILKKLVPLLNEAGVESNWLIIKGSNSFFNVTKAIHNSIHGADAFVTKEMLSTYEQTNEENSHSLDLNDADFVIIHDAQPAALIKYFPDRKGKWVWRCHCDISTPNPGIWEFLKSYVSQYDAAVFHTEKFAKKDLLTRQFVIPPSIDPLSEKNREVTDTEIDRVFEEFQIDREKPIISQIGRFDRLKDPKGVIRVYNQVKRPEQIVDVSRFLRGDGIIDLADVGQKEIDCQLIIAGGLATDDPEGEQVYKDLENMIISDKNAHLLLLPPDADLQINCLQRASQIILQKSLREGFALTVSEALWKSKPVIGANTGGIPLQVIDGLNGYLVNSPEEAAQRVRYLLTNPKKAEEMGKVGKLHIKKNFLITKHLLNHLMLYLVLETMP